MQSFFVNETQRCKRRIESMNEQLEEYKEKLNEMLVKLYLQNNGVLVADLRCEMLLQKDKNYIQNHPIEE